MSNKYYNMISKINTDTDFKHNLVEKLKVEEAKINDNKVRVSKIGLIKLKIKKILITVATIIGILLGSGGVYATIKQLPFLEIFGITFSENYVEYIEPVSNQIVENEDFKIALESTVCDDGFTVLQFRINVKNEDYIDLYSVDDELCATCLSFNDPISNEDGYNELPLGGANYNVIIDGEKIWLRGASNNMFEHVSNSELIFYQIWFFDEDKFGDETEFNLKLEDIVLGLGNDYIPVEGSFEVTVSKDKAKKSTIVFDGGNEIFTYKKSTNKIEKVLRTPMQNIIKFSKLQKNVDLDDLTYVIDEDYIGFYSYIVYDQDGNFLTTSATIPTKEQITYEDGECDNAIPGELMFRQEFTNAELLTHEYLIVEKNNDIEKLRIEICETDDYYGITKKIAEAYIDLNEEKVEIKSFDEIIENDEQEPYQEYLNSDIEYKEDIEIQELELEGLLCQKNTYKSILKNYPDNYYEILEKYCTDYTILGDSSVWAEIESNYMQYELNTGETELENYAEPINIKLAKIDGNLFYHTPDCNSLNIDDFSKLYKEYSDDNFYKLTGMLIMNGNNSNLDEWEDYACAKKIKMIINDEQEYIFELRDTPEVQLINFEYLHNNIEKPIDIKIEVLEKYYGKKSNDVFISDIRFGIEDSFNHGI